MKRRLLLINARRGLGNRLRTVLSGLAYADATGCQLDVLWVPNQQCGAALGELWEHPLHAVSLRRARWTAKLSGGWVDHLETDDLDLARWRRPVLALQCSQPFSNPAGIPWISELRRFRPRPELRKRIDDTWSRLDSTRPVVGLMVRAHASAHTDTAATDPVVSARARAAAIRAAVPDVQFFLSTDSPSAAAHLRRDLDVVELADKGEFNSVRGVQDAVCDLYLLAACHWVVGSHASSFSEIAALLAGHGGYETPRQTPRARLDERLAAPHAHPAQFWV